MLMHPLGVALTGTAVSAGIFDVMHFMGHELEVSRIDDAMMYLRDA